MAPEQAGGKSRQIGPAADVYALGAILYEMLTGRPPFKAATLLDTVLQVISQEPVPPSQLQPQTPRDLETICLKCLQKEPAKRYPTALALAEDVRRFLEGKPIQARPVSAWERGLKWVKRRPAVAALSAVSGGALVTLVSVVLAANARLQEEREDALRQSQRAEANFKRARAAVDELLTEVNKEELAMSVRRPLLEKALKYYEEFLEEKTADPDVRRRTANVFMRMGELYKELGRDQEAGQPYRQGIDLARQLIEEFPDRADYQFDLAIYLNKYGDLQAGLRRNRRAEQLHREGLDLLVKLVADNPREPAYQEEMAGTYEDLSLILEVKRLDDAVTYSRRAAGLLKQLVDTDPAEPRYRHRLAQSYQTLGVLLDTRDDPSNKSLEEALTLWNWAVELHQQLMQGAPHVSAYRRGLAQHFNSLGIGWTHAKPPQLQKAEEAFRKAVQLKLKLTEDFPQYPAYREELATSYANLADVLGKSGQSADAAKALQDAQRVVEKLVNDFPARDDFRKWLDALQQRKNR
jgi:tetratricopeptide (TPR) repeat protein